MHLYIHVPFCVRRCSYCDFSIAVRKRVPAAEYLDAIRGELETRSGWVDPLETLYLGGGTPSLLPPEAIATLLRDVFRWASSWDAPRSSDVSHRSREGFGLTSSRDASRLSGEIEITLEANPEDVTVAAARTWRAAGVNRVSLGAQSFDDRVLRWMHRSHDAARVGAAVATLRDAGITNLSLDLIFGLPAELGRDWRRDLDRACALEPPHLSLYGLTVEERTPLARWISRGATRPPADERYAAEYLEAHERLAAAGYRFYEVSNAARDGRRSRHNSAYWSGRPYLGLGPAAHSFDGRTRRWNLSAWEAYRRAVSAGRSPVESEETLTAEQQELERVYLALRTAEGLPLSDPLRPSPSLSVPLRLWEQQGWVEVTGERVRCTPAGWLRLDALVAALTGDCQTV